MTVKFGSQVIIRRTSNYWPWPGGDEGRYLRVGETGVVIARMTCDGQTAWKVVTKNGMPALGWWENDLEVL